MTEVAEIAELAADGVADGMHIVSEEALAAEKVVRGLEGLQIAYIGLGVAIGAAVGGLIAWNFAYRKAEVKYAEIAAEEIADMRQHYSDKTTAAESESAKGELAYIIRERRYGESESEPPMGVSPPESVVEAAREADEEENSDKMDEVREAGEEVVRNVFREATVEDTWDYHEERRKRSPMKPYVIHIDERDEQQSYDGVTYTYYEEDDVLCNERDEVIAGAERDKLVGELNLEKFGHGSGDASIVYVRNDQLEMDVEVVRSPNSYAEEVHGFEPVEEPGIKHSHRRGRPPETDD